jgi:hypothetical protein
MLVRTITRIAGAITVPRLPGQHADSHERSPAVGLDVPS